MQTFAHFNHIRRDFTMHMHQDIFYIVKKYKKPSYIEIRYLYHISEKQNNNNNNFEMGKEFK